ncbi:hypothetical protein AVEN_9070-1 [Araneus ventricosus]|uniref:Uncharacterized protein n=1 Tax=Araneus ventricosus TaxID=182803 RepID=A0A4Y2T7B3_ARAVE|nr:hypothetical protein AVEN_9070-1 [Araneus ventricosus]
MRSPHKLLRIRLNNLVETLFPDECGGHLPEPLGGYHVQVVPIRIPLYKSSCSSYLAVRSVVPLHTMRPEDGGTLISPGDRRPYVFGIKTILLGRVEGGRAWNIAAVTLDVEKQIPVIEEYAEIVMESFRRASFVGSAIQLPGNGHVVTTSSQAHRERSGRTDSWGPISLTVRSRLRLRWMQ